MVSSICYFPFHIWDVILPIDELICFKMVKTTHQIWYQQYHHNIICPWGVQRLRIHPVTVRSPCQDHTGFRTSKVRKTGSSLGVDISWHITNQNKTKNTCYNTQLYNLVGLFGLIASLVDDRQQRNISPNKCEVKMNQKSVCEDVLGCAGAAEDV